MAVRYCFTEEARRLQVQPPQRAIPGEDAGFDLRALHPCEIAPGGQMDVPTGTRFEIPNDLFGLVCSRTVMAKRGLIPVYQVVDPGYVGELILRLLNTHESETVVIDRGDRVAQIVFVPFWGGDLVQITPEQLKQTRRGEGRLGSTGVK